MDSMSAYYRGLASRDNESRVFDWDKAATLIKEKRPVTAGAGLSEDWCYTGGTIYCDGKPTDKENSYTYLSSTWATPELDLDGEIVDCYKMQSEVPDWNSSTFWPESALAILNSGEVKP